MSFVKIKDVSKINPSKEFVDGKVSFLKMEDVSVDGKIMNKETRDYDEVSKGFSTFKDKDILIAKITPCFENGKGAYVEGLTNGIGFGSTEFHVLRADENRILSKYLFYQVNSENFRKYGEINMTGSAGQKRVPKNFIEQYKIYLPSLEEQKKIVEILSTWDLAIDKQQQLIEKKKEFKKGLMQRLLSGEVRFKEFTDEWRKLTLGDILYEPIKEKVINPSKYELITVKLHCNGVEKTGKFPNVTKNGRPYYFRNPGELLIGRQNFHNGGIAIVPKEIKNNICSNAISSFCAKDFINIDFVYYYLSRSDYYKKVEFLIGGTGQKEISKKEFNNLKISIPNYLEQCKIVEVLKSADKEIELLEKELEALKIQKKGLMQRLLTGEVRVNVE